MTRNEPMFRCPRANKGTTNFTPGARNFKELNVHPVSLGYNFLHTKKYLAAISNSPLAGYLPFQMPR